MAQGIRVGIIGAGWPGAKHAEGYQQASGFQLAAVADLIPARRRKLMESAGIAREYADAAELIKDVGIDAVSICLPNALHLPTALAALKAGKHVIIETPPALSAGEVKKIGAAAEKAGRVVLFAFQRCFGGAEQACRLAIEKGFIGTPYHVRASWMRTRGIPTGTGWYADRTRSGGGAMIDMGVQMLDLAWRLLGKPKPVSAYAIFNRRFGQSTPENRFDVEDGAFALIKFEGDRSVELASTWAINQPPRDNGTKCQVYADKGAAIVYNPQGPLLYRGFNEDGQAKESAVKTPKTIGYHAMMRHFKECIAGGAAPLVGAVDAMAVMHMSDAIYRSAESGKSVEVRSSAARAEPVVHPATATSEVAEDAV